MQHGDQVYAVMDILGTPTVVEGRYTVYEGLPEPVVLYPVRGRVYKSTDLKRWFLTGDSAVRVRLDKLTAKYAAEFNKLHALLTKEPNARPDSGG